MDQPAARGVVGVEHLVLRDVLIREPAARGVEPLALRDVLIREPAARGVVGVEHLVLRDVLIREPAARGVEPLALRDVLIREPAARGVVGVEHLVLRDVLIREPAARGVEHLALRDVLIREPAARGVVGVEHLALRDVLIRERAATARPWNDHERLVWTIWATAAVELVGDELAKEATDFVLAAGAITRRVTEEGHAYDDNEPVESPASRGGGEPGGGEAAANDGELVVIKTHCEFPAIARSTPRDNFAVLLHVKAPSIAAEAAPARASVDLVTVLDVSGSMEGYKLALLKRAMGLLGPGDRLAVVSFSYSARRVIRLTRMSEGGKASAKSAVESLHADGCTNILEGLVEAAKVFDGRRYRNAVASVILLSDGQDNYNVNGGWGASNSKNYSVLVPPSFKRSGDRRLPVHTFGFGTDHDASAMHTIAEETGGTFSFIENQAVVQDAFAQCIGGLLSVPVQEARIAITCPHAAVRVRSVNSGRYDSVIDGDGRAASVDVGELYADEERRFLVFVDVPAAGAGEDVTELIKVSCTYRDTASRQQMVVAGEDAVVQRPAEVSTSTEPSMEVERERFCVEATEDIAAAREAAERGAYAAAKAILDRRQEALARSARRLAGDARCAALVSELRELSARVANRREYEQTGRACMLAGMSSHAQQRATSVQLFSPASALSSGAVPFGYSTPAMQSMVESSRKARESGSGGN
uniref:Zinc finger (C3HC4-type RING finger) protein family-like n=1 Tax=Oryza sativa subsp. japonica TaxID=39947 RepID=Q6ZFR4_ORYSJ|nr:zinc finger (C3HC4-type RING finger) protein family-like [Oryza sativa Japonica Group]BAD09261.1 zinc finger (C3HC4-type RING finger) protein family-like [Oryza sativa Japonica Group]